MNNKSFKIKQNSYDNHGEAYYPSQFTRIIETKSILQNPGNFFIIQNIGFNFKYPQIRGAFCKFVQSLFPLLTQLLTKHFYSLEQLVIKESRKNSHKQFIKHLVAMNLYGLDSSLFELGFNDPSLIESISSSYPMINDRRYNEREEENLLKLSNSILKNIKRASSPPKHRHDGTSPLPLGMDWSPPPRNWVIYLIYCCWIFIRKMKSCYLHIIQKMCFTRVS